MVPRARSCHAAWAISQNGRRYQASWGRFVVRRARRQCSHRGSPQKRVRRHRASDLTIEVRRRSIASAESSALPSPIGLRAATVLYETIFTAICPWRAQSFTAQAGGDAGNALSPRPVERPTCEIHDVHYMTIGTHWSKRPRGCRPSYGIMAVSGPRGSFPAFFSAIM